MYKDCLTNIFNEALNSVIQDIIKNSKTEYEIEEKINKISNNIDENMYKKEIENISDIIFKDVRTQMEEEYENIDKDDKEYADYIKSIWEKGFKLSTCLYDIILETLDKNIEILESEHTKDLKGNESKVKVLQLLSNRSLQTFKSVLILIKNGMGDDAFKLCRSLHENWIISIFIYENNEETAKEFLNITNSSIYKKNDYEWARKSGLFKPEETIYFNEIFKKCNFKNKYSKIWKKQYKKECLLLHTTPHGLTKSLCLPPKIENEIALVGQSPYGLNIAAEHSAIYLINTVLNYLTIFENEWNIITALVLRKILDEIQLEYTNIANEMNKSS